MDPSAAAIPAAVTDPSADATPAAADASFAASNLPAMAATLLPAFQTALAGRAAALQSLPSVLSAATAQGIGPALVSPLLSGAAGAAQTAADQLASAALATNRSDVATALPGMAATALFSPAAAGGGNQGALMAFNYLFLVMMMVIILYWCCIRPCWEQFRGHYMSHQDDDEGEDEDEDEEDEHGNMMMLAPTLAAIALSNGTLNGSSHPAMVMRAPAPRLLSPIPSHELRQLPRTRNSSALPSRDAGLANESWHGPARVNLTNRSSWLRAPSPSR